ncbi:MAG: mechanosensitive ion channel [Anaerolineae bacterium]
MPSAEKVLKTRSLLTRAIAMGVVLAAACLWIASTNSLGLMPARAQEPGQDQKTIGPRTMVALLQETPEDATGEPQPTPSETVAPTPSQDPGSPTETVEPVPSETPDPELTESPEPPQETVAPTPGEPAPGEPTATAEAPAKPGETQQPEPTGPVTATAAAPATATAQPTPTATSTSTATRIDWPLGTIEFGEPDSGPLSQPIQVSPDEWIRLALALSIVVLVAIFGGRVLYGLVVSVVRRRHLAVDEKLLVELRPLMSWWLAAAGFHISVWWVGFENEPARDLFADLAFLAYLVAATLTIWRLVDRAIDLYAERIAAEGQAATVAKLRPILSRWTKILLLLFSGIVALGRLQVGFSAPTILVILLGLAIGLAVRDTLTDAIAGFFILIDQPFRVGDRVEIESVDTWADVVSIGLRTSVLRTRHNVEIIVPNSTIGNNRVVNHSYPDSRLRLQTHVEIAFGADVERARQVLIGAVRQVDGVLADEPVDALYIEVGSSGMIFRLRWWTHYYRDPEESLDSVHTAVHKALAEEGIESPYPRQTLDVDIDDRTLVEVWQVWHEGGGRGLAE